MQFAKCSFHFQPLVSNQPSHCTMHLAQILALALAILAKCIQGYDVLMVVGGMFLENRVGYTLKAVEVIGLTHVCHSFSLPEPRHSLFGGRLSDR